MSRCAFSRYLVGGVALMWAACGGGSTDAPSRVAPEPVTTSAVPRATSETEPSSEAPGVSVDHSPSSSWGLGESGTRGSGSPTSAGGTGSPTIRAADAVMGPALTRDEIQAVVRAHLADVRLCYEQELRTDPSLEGRVSVSFEIGSTGSVTSASTQGATPELQLISECIRLEVETWVFPAPRGGGVIRVTYPFVLSASP